MTTARELWDDVVRTTDDLESRAFPELIVDRLLERLLEHPEEFDAFDDPIREAYEAACFPAREVPRIEDGRFVYRNVALAGPAEFSAWRWPPPTTYDAFTDLVKRAQHVRVLGECWGMSSLTHPHAAGGVLLSGDPYGLSGARVLPGSAPDRVRCLLGATWNEVHDFIDASDPSRCVPNQPGFSGLTVAGSIGTGGHGSSLHLGSLESMVTQIELAHIQDPSQGPIVFQRGEPEFDFAVTHLGRLGPVVGIELQTQPRFQIAETRELRILGTRGRSWKVDLRDLLVEVVKLQSDARVHSAEIWIAPYVDDGELTTVLGIRRYTDEQPSDDKTRPWALRCQALQVLGQILSVVVVKLWPRLIKGILRGIVRQTECERVVMSAREGLDFGAPNSNRMTAIEAAFELTSLTAAVSGVVDTIQMLDQIGSEEDLYLFSPIGIRFVGRGAADGFSPQAGRMQTMHLELPTFGDARFEGPAVLAPVQHHLANKFRARPHWGQRVFLTPKQLRSLWPESTRAGMAQLATRLDGERVFRNPWIDELLGIG